MTAIEYLSQIRDSETRISILRERINETEAALSGVSGIRYDSVGSGGSPKPDAIGERIGKLIDQQDRLEDEIYKLVELKNRIAVEIQRLPNPNHVRILYDRYVRGLMLYKIAAEISYSEDYTYFLHRQALGEFERLILGKDSES